METYEKRILSGSTNGKMIKISASATPGTLIHTAVAGATDKDEVWLYATNNSTSPMILTIEWGGTDSVADDINIPIASKSGLVPITPGICLQNGLEIRAFATSASVVDIIGFVNRISS